MLQTLLARNKYEEAMSDEHPLKEDSTFVIDLIAAIRDMTNLPSTYEGFVWHFVSTLPKGFNRLDIVVDTYRTNSIKGGERNTRVTEIVSEVLRNNFSKVLAKLRYSMVHISQEDVSQEDVSPTA